MSLWIQIGIWVVAAAMVWGLVLCAGAKDERRPWEDESD